MSRQNSREVSSLEVTLNGSQVNIDPFANGTKPFDDVKVMLLKGEKGDRGDSADLKTLAPDFSEITAYAVGAFVNHEGKLYVCTTAHSAGAWNPSHFTETDVDSSFVHKTGDTMTGALTVQGNITSTGSITDGSGNVLSNKINNDAGFTHTDDITYNPDTKTVTCSKSVTNWTSQIYSKSGYVDNVFVTFKPVDKNMYFMIGLDANPSESTSFTGIDYCWFCQGGGSLYIFESGTQITPPAGHTTYSGGDELRIEYSGGYVRYYHNGALVRSVARAIGNPLYLDSSFYNSGSVYDVEFGTGIPALTGERFAKIKHLSMPSNGSVTYEADTEGRGQWAFFVSCEMWATAYSELVYVKGYVTASRSKIAPIVNDGTPITITGSDSSKVYTITNNTSYAFDLVIVELD